MLTISAGQPLTAFGDCQAILTATGGRLHAARNIRFEAKVHTPQLYDRGVRLLHRTHWAVVATVAAIDPAIEMILQAVDHLLDVAVAKPGIEHLPDIRLTFAASICNEEQLRCIAD